MNVETAIRQIFADYKSEGFGDWEVPKEILMLEDIEDLSWHNDEAPSFGKLWDTDDDGNVQIRIYVMHQDEDDEYYGGRFILTVYTTDCGPEIAEQVQAAVAPLVTETGEVSDGHTATLVTTNDPMEAVRLFVTAVVAINQVLRRR